MPTFLNHGVSLLGDRLDAGLMAGYLSLQGLVLLQQVLDTNQVFAWGRLGYKYFFIHYLDPH